MKNKAKNIRGKRKHLVWLICLLLGSLLYVSCSSDDNGNNNPDAGLLSETEMELYSLIMEYRAEKGLPEIPISPSLTYVAQLHVEDLEENFVFNTECNLHSWSDQGDWIPCCYTDDHANADCATSKAMELTTYTGRGYEITYYSTSNNPQNALNAWKNSPGHNNTIINEGTWAGVTWNAVGIGMSSRFSVVWFGKVLEE